MTAMLSILLAFVLGSAVTEDDRSAATRLARETLARVLDVKDGAITVEEVHADRWPDAGLGCPDKGVQYPQASVAGYSVSLNVSGRVYRVHVGNGRAVLCGARSAESPKYMEIVVRVQELARRNLAARLAVETKDVKVLRVRPQTWPDAGLGCPEPGQRHAPAETRGFLIELEHASKTYRYHSDRERVVLCRNGRE